MLPIFIQFPPGVRNRYSRASIVLRSIRRACMTASHAERACSSPIDVYLGATAQLSRGLVEGGRRDDVPHGGRRAAHEHRRLLRGGATFSLPGDEGGQLAVNPFRW